MFSLTISVLGDEDDGLLYRCAGSKADRMLFRFGGKAFFCCGRGGGQGLSVEVVVHSVHLHIVGRDPQHGKEEDEKGKEVFHNHKEGLKRTSGSRNTADIVCRGVPVVEPMY